MNKIIKPLKYFFLVLWGAYQIILGIIFIGILICFFWAADYTNYFAIKSFKNNNPNESAFIINEKKRIEKDSVLQKRLLYQRKRRAKKDLIWQDWLSRDSIPEIIREVTLIAEDGKFFAHHGFDLDELQYALVSNHQKGKKFRGASTISQQVVKNLFLSSEKTYERKLKEALMTVMLEHYLSKDRILEIYLNIAQFAPGVFGIQAGAQHHYGKPVFDLEMAEIIDLIALLPSPKKWHPQSGYKAYRRHRMRIIKNLAIYKGSKEKLPLDVRERFAYYAEIESRERWKKLYDGRDGEKLDSLPPDKQISLP